MLMLCCQLALEPTLQSKDHEMAAENLGEALHPTIAISPHTLSSELVAMICPKPTDGKLLALLTMETKEPKNSHPALKKMPYDCLLCARSFITT